MKRSISIAAALLFASQAFAQEPPAKIRLAGVFLQGFSVWRTELPNCAPPAGKPWMNFDCGFFKCPKPQILGIPLELDYSNWRKSPRVTELEIEAGKPLSLHLGGALITGSVWDGVSAVLGTSYTLHSSSCYYDLGFTPRAGAMYEATIDPARESGCFLRFTEIRAKDTGIFDRFAVEDARMQACEAPAKN